MNVLNKILQAREGRFALRKRFASEGRASLSLSLNIPGYPKTTPGISWFFKKATVDLQRFLTAHRVGTYPKDAVDHPDEAGDFFIVPLKKNSLSLREIKHICETFEESHPVGRVIDVDVTGPDMENISSGKAKTCFICKSTPAIQCMRENTHTKEELRKYIFAQIVYYVEKYREKDTCRKLATFALKAVLYEVSLSPKPGAVDRFDPGSHDDMDFFTFMNSSAALSPYFYEMARAGFRFDPDLGFPAALPIIRTIGLEMEENMFSETGGVNTQKGIIFLAGLCLFSAAFVINIHGFLDPGAFIAIIREITKGITQDELAKPSEANSDTPLTHGETCFQRFGEQLGAGIRWEVEHGLPTVLKTALPTLLTEIDHSGAFIKEDHLKQALTTTLLAIMSVNNDTNILFRRGPGQLEQVKKTARETLQETDPGKKEILYRQLSDYCLAENISPGGSVDLLAITLFIFFARKEFTKK